jgi:hypothetical protein
VNGSKGNQIKKWYTAAQVNCSTGTGNCSLTPSTTLIEGTGKWWVRTWNSSGYGKWSPELTFSIERITVTRVAAIKLLRQTSFTSYETEIDEVMQNGEMAWIQKQLNAKSAFDDLNDTYYGYLESVVRLKIEEEPTKFPPSILEDLSTKFPESFPTTYTLDLFNETVLLEKMFESKDQLRHRMALALSQIVVVSRHATTGISLSMKGEGLIKFYDDLYKHSFGNYRDVLKSASMSAAMSYFLTFLGNKKEDNVTNTAPDENYAR